MAESLTVHDLGELGLLQRLQPWCAQDVMGDDAAVLDLPVGQQLVVTTDVLVDGVHFSDRTTSAQDVGWRAVAANLSDLAAMGAAPIGITVGLSLPRTLPVHWVDDLYAGMGACLQTYGGRILGGDLCRAETIAVAITALGCVEPGWSLYRRTARPGQVILVTGYHGLSRAGLELLLHPPADRSLTAVEEAWVLAHQRPRPRFDAIAHLRSLMSARGGMGHTIAAMDTSDGLANAVLQVCQASGVGARLERSQLPISPDLVAGFGSAQATDWTLYGGEDFELLLCLAQGEARELLPRLGQGAAVIGVVTAEPGVVIAESLAAPHLQPLTLEQGFQHF